MEEMILLSAYKHETFELGKQISYSKIHNFLSSLFIAVSLGWFMSK